VHRGEHPDLMAGLGAAMGISDGRAIHHRACELGLHRHVGELELDGLVLGYGDSECSALLGVCKRCVKARLRDADRQRGDRNSAAHERVEELPVTATTLSEKVLFKDLAALKAQRVRVGRM